MRMGYSIGRHESGQPVQTVRKDWNQLTVASDVLVVRIYVSFSFMFLLRYNGRQGMAAWDPSGGDVNYVSWKLY